MKLIFFFALLSLSINVYALEDPSRYRQCFDSAGKNKIRSCLVVYGTDKDSKYTELSFRDKIYHIKQPIACKSEDCEYEMGEDLNYLTEAEKYFLDRRLKVISSNSNTKIWTCYKQVSGEINVCFKVK